MRPFVPTTLACCVLAACSEPFTPESIAGVYSLTRVNDLAVPATVTYSGGSNTFQSGTITLTDAGTYTFSLSYRNVEDGVTANVTFSNSGTYTLTEPSTVHFSNSNTASTWEGGQLTVAFFGYSLTFERT